jgi:periplasmic protein CpxP/Spy
VNRKYLMLIAGAIVAAGTLTACGPHRYNREDVAERAASMVESATHKLDLDGAQKTKLDVVKTMLLAARDAAESRHEAERQEIAALLSQPTLDRARTGALVTSHTRAIETKAPEVIAAFGDFYDSLRPEQQQKLREHVETYVNGHCH